MPPPRASHRAAGRRPVGLRATAAAVLVALACTSFAASVGGVWVRRSLLDDATWTGRSIQIVESPEVQEALASYLTDELLAVLGLRDRIADVLPDDLELLAGPLVAATGNLVEHEVQRVVGSEAFRELWVVVLTRAHDAATRVLRGDDDVLASEGDDIVINLVPVLHRVLEQVAQVAPELFGAHLDLPDVSADEDPATAAARIGRALGVTVPEDWGVVRLEGGGAALATAREVVRLLDLWVLAAVTTTIVFSVGAVWTAPRRRRTILQLAVGAAVGLVLLRLAVRAVEGRVLDQVREPVNHGAAEVVLGVFVDPLLGSTTAVLVILASVTAIAAATGPYPWARDLRASLARWTERREGGPAASGLAEPRDDVAGEELE